jgi:hypothetical protein
MTRRATCRICGHRLAWVARRFAWVHARPGADHAPIPSEVTA